MLNDIDVTGGCCCAGCIGMGLCDLGEECDYGCGARVTKRGDVCDSCERDALGDDDAIEMEYADGDYDWSRGDQWPGTTHTCLGTGPSSGSELDSVATPLRAGRHR